MNQIFRFCKFDPFLLSRHYGSQGNPTHYDILRVPQTASQKDIKEAFIKLSKEMHPDIKGNQSHSEFVKINEAYKVLSKEILRRDYDMNLKYGTSSNVSSNSPHSSNNFYYYRRPPNFHNKEEYEQYTYSQTDDNYNVNRKKRINTFGIACICVIIATISAFLQVFLINKRVLESQHYYAERTLRFSKELNEIRDSAKSKTKEQQIQDFLKKVEAAKSNNLKTNPQDK